jgi:hypothetical protein
MAGPVLYYVIPVFAGYLMASVELVQAVFHSLISSIRKQIILGILLFGS